MERKYFIDYSKKHVLDDGSIEYCGYVFHKEGYIISPNGKKLTITRKTGHIRIDLYGKQITVKAGRFIYELMNDVTLRRSEIVVHKDGDLTNIAFDNLEYMGRKEYFKEHTWAYKFSEEEEKQIYDEYHKGQTSIQKLSDKYRCCTTTIWNIVNGKYRGKK